MAGFGGVSEGGCVAIHTSQDRAVCFTEDNRLKVWDVLSGEMQHSCVSSDHLAAKYTSISWCAGEGKKARGVVVVGTSVGSVLLWDVNKGELVKTLNGGAKDKAGCCVWDVAISHDGKTVWSCASDGFLYQWDTKSGDLVKKWKGEKSEVRKLCTVSTPQNKDKYLLSGRCRLKMWDLSTHEVVHKLTGHGNPLLDVKVTSDGQYCATCATGDRFVNLWSLNLDKPNEQAISVLVFDSFIKQLDVRVVRGGKGKKKEGKVMEVAGVAVDGEKVALWSSSLGQQKRSGGSVKVRGVITTPSRATSPFLHCEFGKGEERNAVVLRGLRMKPVFDVVEVKKDEQFVTVDMEALPGHLLTKKGEKKARKEEIQKHDASVVSGVSSKGMKKGEDISQKSALVSKRKEGGRGEGVTVDVPVTDTRSFLEKLEALEKHVVKPVGSKKGGKKKGDPKKAESLQVAIEQALHSDDPVLLESCLEISSEITIQNTCQRLSAPYVVPFLMALIKRFEKNANRAGKLVPWIRGVLIFHGSYLMTQPDLEKSLGNFRDLIDQRLATFNNLLKLSGRLEILISQLSMREKANQGVDYTESRVFVEGEDGEVVEIDSDDEGEESESEGEESDSEGEEEEEEGEEGDVIYMTDEDEEDEAEFAYETPDEEGEESEESEEEESDSD